MSWLSKGLKKVGKVAKKGLKAVGKGWEAIDDYVAPAVGFALGGPAGAAAGSALARATGNGKLDLKQTALAGLKGYAGGQLAGAVGLSGGQGLKTLGSSAISAATNPVATAGSVLKSQVPGVAGAAAGGAPAAGGMGGLQKLGSLAQPIMGGLAMYEGYKTDKEADKLRKKQLAMAEGSYNERAPMRTLGRDLMLNQTPPDLSYIYANSSNPFSKRTG